MAIFKGAGVAIVTPFDEAGNVNYDVLGKMIDFQIENGTDAIIIFGLVNLLRKKWNEVFGG